MAIVLMLAGISSQSWGQAQSQIFEYNTPVTWLGVDFSEVRYMGDLENTADGNSLKTVFPKINDLIVNEPEKYNLKNAFYKQNISPNLDAVSRVNEKLDPSDIVTTDLNDYSRMDESFIQKMVSKYKFENVDPVGLVIIMEGMNKSIPQASMWVTFVDTKSNKVLFTKRLTSKAGGFGLRNYWASSIHKVFTEVEKKEFKKWKKGKS